MSHTIVHFEIPADEPEKLASFYRELFEWKIERLPGEVEYWGITTVAVDDEVEPGVNGGMIQRQVPQQMPINYVSVESLEHSVAKAKALGATVVIETIPVSGMGWFAQLVDPQGNPFAIFQEVRKS